MYINELALRDVVDDKQRIREIQKQFILLYKEIDSEGKLDWFLPEQQKLRFTSTVYTLEEWLHDVSVEKSLQRVFLSLNKRIRYYNPDEDMEAYYGNEKCYAIAEAVLNGENMIVTLPFDDKWERQNLEAECHFIEEDDVQSETNSIRNLYNAKQVETLKQEGVLFESLCATLSYEDLWEKREKLFTNLIFIPSVKDNLMKLEISYSKQIILRLKELDDYIKLEKGHGFNYSLIRNATPESKATLEKYGKIDHTFLDANGKKYLANWHVRFTGIPGRIFFEVDIKNGKIVILYIGSKLKNVKYS